MAIVEVAAWIADAVGKTVKMRSGDDVAILAVGVPAYGKYPVYGTSTPRKFLEWSGCGRSGVPKDNADPDFDLVPPDGADTTMVLYDTEAKCVVSLKTPPAAAPDQRGTQEQLDALREEVQVLKGHILNLYECAKTTADVLGKTLDVARPNL